MKTIGVWRERCLCLSSLQISNPLMSGKSTPNVMRSNLCSRASSIPFSPVLAASTSQPARDSTCTIIIAAGVSSSMMRILAWLDINQSDIATGA